MAELITRRYGDFRGVDLRPEQQDPSRSPDACNLWRDYRAPAALVTRPSMQLHTQFTDAVWGIFFYDDLLLVHSGSGLYRIQNGEKQLLRTGLAENPSQAFLFENIWYFKDGANYLAYDGSEIREVDGFVPTTSIGRSPAGGGSRFQDVNMLTGRRRNSFLADGLSFDYHLDTQELDEDFRPLVTVDGVPVEDFTVDWAAGVIRFTQAPGLPLTDGQDNVTVEFSRTVRGYREAILGCRLLQVFDNRVFFSGCPGYPNLLWHCSLGDPSYVSDLDYYREGVDDAPIRGLAAGNNALWVFREPSDAGTSVFYHVPTLDEEYGKIYPSSHSGLNLGCTGAAANFADDIVFFSPRGMEGVSGDITTRQFAHHRSSTVDRLLTAHPGYRDMRLAQWRGYLLVAMGDVVCLADSRATFQNQGHREYEWFVWQLEQPVTCLQEHGGVLYLGTAQGVCTLSGQAPVRSWWTTIRDRMGYPHRRKTAHRRGCTAELTGEVTLLSRTDRTDFRPVGEFTQVGDAIAARLREKKFKDLQLKFDSQSRFSLESATVQAWLGDYIQAGDCARRR